MADENIEAGPLPDIETLEIVADWKADFIRRQKRARLRHELIGLSPEEIASLGAEAADFGRLCAVLKGIAGHA